MIFFFKQSTLQSGVGGGGRKMVTDAYSQPKSGSILHQHLAQNILFKYAKHSSPTFDTEHIV